MSSSPDRLLRLSGASNFRDLGGYVGHGGQRVRWRRLYRSDHLGALTASDKQKIAERGITAAFDFRGLDERAAAPYELPGLAQHALAIEPTVAQRMHDIAASGRLTVPVVEGLMRDLYRGLVGPQSARFAALFRHLLRAEAPVVFHCTAGKDRTGVAAALLLLALGVSREVVMEDYLLTNRFYRRPFVPRADVPPEVQHALWSVQPGYLEAALETVEREAGGPARYLRTRLGLGEDELAELSRRYLEDLGEGVA